MTPHAMQRGRAWFVVPAAAILALVQSGCLICADRRESYSGEGKAVPAATVERIEPGTTSVEKLHALLGEPSHKATLDDGSQIHRYDYRKEVSERVKIFLLLDADNEKTDRQRLYFEVVDGVVASCWQESEEG